MAPEEKEQVKEEIEIEGTLASNNVTFTEEISPISEIPEDHQNSTKKAEEFEVEKSKEEKENKLTILLTEYKNRIDQNKQILK